MSTLSDTLKSAPAKSHLLKQPACGTTQIVWSAARAHPSCPHVSVDSEKFPPRTATTSFFTHHLRLISDLAARRSDRRARGLEARGLRGARVEPRAPGEQSQKSLACLLACWLAGCSGLFKLHTHSARSPRRGLPERKGRSVRYKKVRREQWQLL